MEKVTIRKGTENDCEALHKLIVELAIFEKEPNAVDVSVDQLREHGFGQNPYYEFLVAEVDNEIAGIALYYYKYSTWKGPSLYLEDLIVSAKHRRKGIGEKLVSALKEKAQKEKMGRFEWQVLDWNESAINFYKKLGADFDGEWLNVQLKL
jgi:GNAT superfamily N-acetyltransferase